MKTDTTKSWLKNNRRALTIFAALFIGGCATDAAKKPQAAASAVSTPVAAVTASKAAPGQSDLLSRNTDAGSSLDALRDGKAAAEGPMKTIYFEFDSFDLSADARATLKSNSAWLKANPSSMVEIEGHCDERGTTEYNLALGAKRARAAMDYLAALGVNPARMKTVSYGEEVPACREASEACYQQNRRDRFVEIRPRPAF
jgi:peptidoglycan-associated lipoprotein